MSKERMAPLVLFVCTGNTCRSAMAEAFCRLALPPGSRWRVASAGLSTSSGKPASTNTIQAVAELGGDISAHRSQPMSPELASDAALIVTMTYGHADYLRSYYPDARDRIYLLASFLPNRTDKPIDDPFGGTLEDYRACRDLIRKAVMGLVRYLEQIDTSCK